MSDDDERAYGMREFIAELCDVEPRMIREVRYTWPADDGDPVIEVGMYTDDARYEIN